MSPRAATLLATRLYPYRRAFLIVSLTGIALLGAAFFLVRTAFAANLVSAAFGPFVFVPWTLMCLCAGFGPGGKLREPADSVAKNAWRWYIALYLAVFFILACAWPFLVFLM